jgi:NADH:ubiquinone oxidoreductase subunit C
MSDKATGASWMVRANQNESAADAAVSAINSHFSKTGVVASVLKHSSGSKRSYVSVECPPEHWLALAKWLRFDNGVNHCSMITGIHHPDGGADKGWEVVAHLMRMPVKNQKPGVAHVMRGGELEGNDIPMEYEIGITLPPSSTPTVPSVQSVWVGADWNEKETWDLVGINFEGHLDMMRVLNPHDSPVGFHPLQKQHRLRYDGFNEMYDDAQGFGRKPIDADKVK